MNPPATLPTYIFLLSDTSTRQLACDVATALAEADNAVFVDDFLSPIHEAFSAMWELDMKRDLASPKDTNRLFVPHGDGEQTESDYIINLERWFGDQFGASALGEIAFKRAQEMRADLDYTFVFRDASMSYIKPFISHIGWHKLLFVWIAEPIKMFGSVPSPIPTGRTLQWLTVPDAEGIVKAIKEFDA